MTDDLVQRLRRTYRKEFPVTGSMIADNSNRLRPFPILAAEVPFNPDGHEAADRIEALQADNAKLRAALAPFVDFWEWDTIKTFMDYPVSQCFTPATFLRAVKTFHETSETFTRSSDT